jgi:lipopolysaccharide/colanic/teichoic acid biosynthesis glycosyltransferase
VDEEMMKIVVTGASGFIGRQLIPILEKQGHELLLVGRDPARLRALHRHSKCCSLDEVENLGRSFDILLHLAVLNNTGDYRIEDFERANVSYTLAALHIAQLAMVKKFYYFSSFHALNERNSSAYAQSKRLGAERALAESTSLTRVVVFFLPAVYGEVLSGRLARLRGFPVFIRSILLKFVSAFYPIVKIDRVAEAILDARRCEDGASEIILSDGNFHNPVFSLFTSVVDFSVALVLVLLFWWVFLIVALIVKLDSEGPALIRQRRVGKDGKIFKCWKFRTMYANTEPKGTHDVSAKSVTKVGRVLRRTKLDELPQVLNIIRGEMSLVGPRPCLPVQGEVIKEREVKGVFSVLPGITGLSQIKGIDMSNPKLLAQFDARYLALRSIPLYLKILFLTVRGRGQGDRIRQSD